jgi:hypothetical protein
MIHTRLAVHANTPMLVEVDRATATSSWLHGAKAANRPNRLTSARLA